MPIKTVSTTTANRLDGIVDKWDAYMDDIAEYTAQAKKDKEYHDGLLSRRMKEVWGRKKTGTYYIGCLAGAHRKPHCKTERKKNPGQHGGLREASALKVNVIMKGTTHEFPSIVQAARFLCMTAQAISYRISHNVVKDGVKINLVDAEKKGKGII